MSACRTICAWALVLFTVSEACIRVYTPTPGIPAAPCKRCAAFLIMMPMTGPGAKKMDDDSITTTGACAVRTFTCKGTQATIAVTTGAGTTNVGDGGTGTATYTVTCNAAGTAWTNGGQTVTAVECRETVGAACTQCAANLIMVDPPNPADPGVKMMDSDVPGMTADGCAMRTLTCMGTLPIIEINGGATTATGSTKATAVVTCNAAGTAWERNGVAVTRLSCNIPCRRCVAADVMISSVAPGTVTSTDATIVRTGACATWDLKCTGPTLPKWVYNGATSVGDADDGVTDGVATMSVTCDKTGKFWNIGTKLTTMVCSAV